MGALDPIVHARLIADFDRIALQARVPGQFLHTSAKGFLSEEELKFLKTYPEWSKFHAGAVFVGAPNDIVNKFCAMAAALMRNFKDARIVMLNEFYEDGVATPDPTIMFVPNFFEVLKGQALPSWSVQKVYNVLLDRRVRGKKTILYVQDMDAMRKYYGEALYDHLKQNYAQVS